MKYTDPTGLNLDDWQDNGDGTWTVKSEGAKLWDLYGADWKEKSGYDGDPTKLQIGDIVGKKREYHDLWESIPNTQPSLTNNNESKNSIVKNYGFGAKASLVFGLGFEIGIISCGKNVALYFTGSYGTGVQVSTGKYSNVADMLAGTMNPTSLFSPSVGGGGFEYGTTTSTTADISLGVVGTYDLHNLNKSGLPNNWSAGSVGGGVWYNSTTIFPLFKRRK